MSKPNKCLIVLSLTAALPFSGCVRGASLPGSVVLKSPSEKSAALNVPLPEVLSLKAIEIQSPQRQVESTKSVEKAVAAVPTKKAELAKAPAESPRVEKPAIANAAPVEVQVAEKPASVGQLASLSDVFDPIPTKVPAVANEASAGKDPFTKVLADGSHVSRWGVHYPRSGVVKEVNEDEIAKEWMIPIVQASSQAQEERKPIVAAKSALAAVDSAARARLAAPLVVAAAINPEPASMAALLRPEFLPVAVALTVALFGLLLLVISRKTKHARSTTRKDPPWMSL